MKSYELKPTYKNLVDSIVGDTIGRNNDIYMFAEILNTLNDSCSIAVDGKWGSGKTFFVKQAKLFIDAHNEFVNSMNENDKMSIKAISKNDSVEWQAQVSVYYDAWENDHDIDPVLSLIYSIISSVDTDFSIAESDSCLKKAASILELFTERNWTGVVNSLNGDDPLDEIRKNKDIESKIKDFFDSLLAERGNRLIVFIDELDRCKPSYAVKLLERIKHYFCNDRITFIFSINTQELQHTIRRHYGENFDAYRYLDRFFDLRITLPPANKSKFYQSINFNNSYYTYDIVCGAVIENYDLQLREITKYIRLTKIAAYQPTHENSKFDFSFPDGKAREFCLLYIVPIMIGLKIYNTDLYEKFVSGKDYTPLVEVMIRLQHYNFDNFFNRDETFNKKEIDKKLVTLEDKLKQIYDALFVTVYSSNHYQTVIGNYDFEDGMKDILLRTVSMLSQYTSLDID